MKTARKSLPLLLALALVAGAARADTAGGEAPRAHRSGVGGQVLGEAAPLPAAGVYAYQLGDLSVRKVLTDARAASCSRTSRRASTRSSRTSPASSRSW